MAKKMSVKGAVPKPKKGGSILVGPCSGKKR